MNYYTVPLIGNGSDPDPFRPDLPGGVSFVGQSGGNDYLIATPHDLSEFSKASYHMPRQALETVCNARGLTYSEVAAWMVGGS